MGSVLPVQAQGLFGDNSGSTALYQDRKPRRASTIGDILTILVTETTSASNSTNISTAKNATVGITSQPGTGGLGFIPGFGLTSAADANFTGDGSTARSQQLQARLSVTVVGLKANGDLIVEGSRTIEINGEREIIYLSGAVNPKIIPATNTIEAYRVSDLQVSYKGKGVLQDASRPGLFVRFVNWIF
ncbi:MAG: flagellar basal body L-ring protein FlgH [Candidatus Latescibacteria bacterium]|nr:flagellar basal body L-ring protein FlgH [Candidatus Latescibacterota bacterium]MBT5829816.1 flagellar basal body L-ring protein FlgH [Candidatus Latescibacterota bacterium]